MGSGSDSLRELFAEGFDSATFVQAVEDAVMPVVVARCTQVGNRLVQPSKVIKQYAKAVVRLRQVRID